MASVESNELFHDKRASSPFGDKLTRVTTTVLCCVRRFDSWNNSQLLGSASAVELSARLIVSEEWNEEWGFYFLIMIEGCWARIHLMSNRTNGGENISFILGKTQGNDRLFS